MSRVDLVCLIMIMLGFALFLCGANFFDVVIGWVGVYLIIGGILVFLLFYIYNELTKKNGGSKSVEVAVFFLKILQVGLGVKCLFTNSSN